MMIINLSLLPCVCDGFLSLSIELLVTIIIVTIKLNFSDIIFLSQLHKITSDNYFCHNIV